MSCCSEGIHPTQHDVDEKKIIELQAFDYMSEEQQNRIIDRLAGNLLTCIKDQHGNHASPFFITSLSVLMQPQQ